MAQTAANVIVGKPLITGGLLVADIGTDLPASASDSLDADFAAIGYAAQGGVTQTIDSSTSDIVAWGGDVVRTIETQHKLMYQFKMIETASATLAVYYGDANVSGTTDLSVSVVSGDLPRKSWVIEVRDGAKAIRIVCPDAQVTERGEVVYTEDDAVGYDITLTCYPDADGVKAYIYTSDGVA